MKRRLTGISEQTTMVLAGETEAGSAAAQPARDSRLKATNGRWGGPDESGLPHMLNADNSESCNALKNLIKWSRRRRIQYLPKAERVS